MSLRFSPRHRSRGASMLELVTAIVIVGILGTVSIGQFVDFREESRASVNAYQQNSIATRIGAASQANLMRSQSPTAGSRIAKWEYSCTAGNQLAQLLDDRSFEGGYGGFWFKKDDGTPDFTRFWFLGPNDDTIPHGEMKECTATRNGTVFTYMVWGCTTWECRCNTYPSDCENY